MPAPVALAGVDFRRLLLRPTTLFALYVTYRVLFGNPPGDAYDGVNRFIGLTLAILGLGAMAIVASIAGRDRGVELVEALPRSGRTRTSSWMVLLAGVALVEYVVLLVSLAGMPERIYTDLLPNSWELTQGPIMLLGGGLLGLIAARRLPAYVAAPLAVIASLLWVGLSSKGGTMLAPMVEWVQYHDGPSPVTLEPGNFAWHNAFLLGLCGLGVVAALLLEPGRRRALVIAGSLLAVGTIVAGALALP
jgi:hypothetical protein